MFFIFAFPRPWFPSTGKLKTFACTCWMFIFPLLTFNFVPVQMRKTRQGEKAFAWDMTNLTTWLIYNIVTHHRQWSCNLLHSSITLLSRFRLASIEILLANSAVLCLFENTNWLQSLGFRSCLMSVGVGEIHLWLNIEGTFTTKIGLQEMRWKFQEFFVCYFKENSKVVSHCFLRKHFWSPKRENF